MTRNAILLTLAALCAWGFATPVEAQMRFESEWLYMTRDNQGRSQYVNGGDTVGTSANNSNFAPGYRFTLGGAFLDYEVEGVFTQINNWNQFTSGTLVNPLILDNSVVAGADHFAFPLGINRAATAPQAISGAAGPNSNRLNAGALFSVEKNSRFQSYEVNFGSNRNQNWWRIGIGLRQINFADSATVQVGGLYDDPKVPPGATPDVGLTPGMLDYAGFTSVAGAGTGFPPSSNPANGPVFLTITNQGHANNQLTGGQAILGARLFPGDYFTLDGTMKAGVYQNTVTGTVTEVLSGSQNNANVYLRSLINKQNSAAFAGSVGLKAIVPLTDYINFTTGYEAMFLSGVALGANQSANVTNSLLNRPQYSVTASNTVILHGVNVGLELTW